jgi:DNA-binding transcriptional ArsR family regulator
VLDVPTCSCGTFAVGRCVQCGEAVCHDHRIAVEERLYCRAPDRRGIVERLATDPATVGEATGGFGVSKSAISKHLKVLEKTGVVTRVIEGRTHRLSLEPEALGEAADWMGSPARPLGAPVRRRRQVLKEEDSR